MKISLCMIVLNEEEHLRRCLKSTKGVADEIIIVDTGSDDNTKLVASEFTDKIYDFVWCDDFSAARNFSFSKASKDFIMWLDADDIILAEDRLALITLKSQLTQNIDAVMLKYNNSDQSGETTFSYYRERLVNRSSGFLWKESVHEYLDASGNIIEADIAITHMPQYDKNNNDRNIRIYENMLKKGENLTPRGTFYYARELKESGCYYLAAAYFKKYLKEGLGWEENKISACCDLYRCLYILDEEEAALNALYKSFVYDLPRAETCCLLGYHYKKEKKHDYAIYWFETALRADIQRVNGFINTDWHGYIPALELSCLYYAMGNLEKAVTYNNLAGKHKPNDNSYIHNKKFYDSLTAKEKGL